MTIDVSERYFRSALKHAFGNDWLKISVAAHRIISDEFKLIHSDPPAYGYSEDVTMKELAQEYADAIGAGQLVSYVKERMD